MPNVPRCSRNRSANLPVLAASVTVLLLAACQDQEKATIKEVVRPVVTMVVADAERMRTDVYPGRAKATREVNIGFEVPGKLLERSVDVGDTVKEGDILGTLEPDRYDADVKRFEGEKAALDATLTNAVTELKRREYLLKKGHVAQARVDNQIMIVRAAKAKIRAVQAVIDRANVDLSYTVLKAPFAGTISNVFVESFQNVLAKQPVVRLLDTSRIEMEVAVPEGLIGLASYVTDITVRFPSLPGIDIPAQIKEVGNEASATTRTYPVTILLDQPDGAEIRPGMAGQVTARVDLPSDLAERGIEVPAGAVFSPEKSTPDQVFVWIVDEQGTTVSRRAITVAGLSDRGLRVTGLKPGERIVIAGVSYLAEGQKVRISQN